MDTNIDFWEKILNKPSPAFSELFIKEQNFLSENIVKGSYVLEIGCGDGRNIKNILKVTNKIVGIDNDSHAINDAKANLQSNPDVELLVADAFSLPFPDETFDVVVLMMTLVNFEDKKLRALKEMARVLKHGGAIIMSVYSENALPERLSMYNKIGVPIDRTEDTKVVFNKSVGAHVSEQFSQSQLNDLVEEAGLTVSLCEGVGNLAYICKLKRK